MALRNKHLAFIDSYFTHFFNATEAYCDVYGVDNRVTAATNGGKLLRNAQIKAEIDRRMAEKTASADEILLGLTEQGRATMADFHKLVEEWTYYPLPSYEIIDAKEVVVTDTEGKPTGEKKISYWVRHVVLDMEKLIDPRYAHLVQEFSDSRDKGTKIKLYDKQAAWRDIAKLRGLIVDKTEISGRVINVNIEPPD